MDEKKYFGCDWSINRNTLSLMSSDNVPNSYWNRDNRQANLNRNNPSNRNSKYGVRVGVWVLSIVKSLEISSGDFTFLMTLSIHQAFSQFLHYVIEV